MYSFYKENEEALTPSGLSWFQADWDPSTQDFYHHTLSKQDYLIIFYENIILSYKLSSAKFDAFSRKILFIFFLNKSVRIIFYTICNEFTKLINLIKKYINCSFHSKFNFS